MDPIWGSLDSFSVFQDFQKILKKGQNILQMAAICKKLETDREKLLPFVRNTQQKEMQEHPDDELRQPPEEFKEETAFVMDKMENFWLRYNNARIDCLCLEQERASLKSENLVLKQKLREYLTNMAISGGNAESSNERLRPHSMKVEKLVTIDLRKNASEMMSEKNRSKRRPVTCIEGNLSVAVRSQKLLEERVKIPDIFSITH